MEIICNLQMKTFKIYFFAKGSGYWWYWGLCWTGKYMTSEAMISNQDSKINFPQSQEENFLQNH